MADVLTWSEPPEALSLATGEVHVWRLALDQPESVLAEFRRTLDAGELERGWFKFWWKWLTFLHGLNRRKRCRWRRAKYTSGGWRWTSRRVCWRSFAERSTRVSWSGLGVFILRRIDGISLPGVAGCVTCCRGILG